MAENILDELRLLVKKQARLQQEFCRSLSKAEKWIEYSLQEEKNNMQNITKVLKHLPPEKKRNLKKSLKLSVKTQKLV